MLEIVIVFRCSLLFSIIYLVRYYSKQKMLAYKESLEQQNKVWERDNMGNYRLVFSDENAHLYEHFFNSNESSLYRTQRSKCLIPFQTKVY